MLRYNVIILTLLCLSARLFAQNQTLRFDRISLEQGLSQSRVSAIVQDRKGFLWFGTQEGLNKYDGYDFTVYKYDPDDSCSLSAPYINAVYEDRSGVLWIGSGDGLFKFEPGRNSIRQYRQNPSNSSSLSDNFVTAIHEDRSGSLWIGTRRGGLNQLMRETNEFKHYMHDLAASGPISRGLITDIYEDRTGNLWVATITGLNKLNRESNTFTRYLHDPARVNSLSSNRITSICEDPASRGVLWIGTSGGGLNRFDRARNSFRHYRHEPDNPNSLSSNAINVIYADSDKLWIGTADAGLNVFDPETETFTHYLYDSADPHSISSNSITSIYEDKSGILWIGTDQAGLNKYDNKRKKFNHYKRETGKSSTLSDNTVWSIHQTRPRPALRPGTNSTGAVLAEAGQDSTLWIGTCEGLNRWDRKKNVFKHYRHDPQNPNSLSNNDVLSIGEHPDEAGKVLWVGTRGGLDKFDLKNEQFTHYRHDPQDAKSLSDNAVSTLYVDRAGAFWVGTGRGLNKFDRESKTFTIYPRDGEDSLGLRNAWIFSIMEDNANCLWVGTNVGLIQFDRDRNHFVHYRHDHANPRGLSRRFIMSLCQDAAGNLWIGTLGGGLNKLVLPTPIASYPACFAFNGDQTNGSLERKQSEAVFARFTEKDGLCNNVIYGIINDRHGNLWLSTNRGLSRFDPATESFENYDPSDGLQSYEFNAGACLKSQSGEMFFGGINGFNSFYPDSVKENPFVPPVVITAFKKVDEVVPFDRDISEVEKIALSYQDNFFSFEFVALDYTNPQKNQYAYKLEGFDRDWVHCGTRRYASYTNLDPGQYIFRVKGSNSDGAWNEEGVAVKITIHPPFWLTWWFIALLAGTLLGATVFFHKNRVRQKIRHALAIERARLLENERVRQQIAHDFHDELGNKLTNIFLFSEILHRKLEQVAPENIEYVNKIGWALKGLSGGIRDFVWILDPKQDSLQDVAIRLRDYAEEVFNGSGIDFQMPEPSNGLDGIKLSMDWRRHLTLLFKEAINNVRQHANCRQATMEFSANGERLAITLADDGKGFDPANCAAGNGLRYMRKRAEKLAGEIEIVSNIGKGTMIRFGSRYPQNGA